MKAHHYLSLFLLISISIAHPFQVSIKEKIPAAEKERKVYRTIRGAPLFEHKKSPGGWRTLRSSIYALPIKDLETRGKWAATSPTNFINVFSQNSGFVTFNAVVNAEATVDDYFEINLYDGNYIDRKAIKISFLCNNQPGFDYVNSTVRGKMARLQILIYNNFEEQSEQVCQGDYQIGFLDYSNLQPYRRNGNVFFEGNVQIWIKSYDCEISLFAETTTKETEYETNVMNYSIIMTLLCGCHIFACIYMIRCCNTNEMLAQGYSLITLTIVTSWDIFICFFHLYEAIYLEVKMLHFFVTPAFWYCILTAVFETRLLTIIWKIKYARNYETMSEIRRGYGKFSFRVYGFMATFLFFSYFHLLEEWFLVLSGLFLVPQIIHNAIRGQRPRFDPFYILFLGAFRAILPLYVKGCPNSIYKLTPQLSFVSNYMGTLLLQVVTLYLQSKLGSRFFIPSFLLPAKYNYFHKAHKISLEKEECCSICMDRLIEMSIEIQVPLLKVEDAPIMKTPCSHFFHEKCLKDWMEIKLECPYCRAKLPSLED